MKKLSLLSMFMLLTIVLTAQQTITLKFTASSQNGSYMPYNVVNVTNVTRGWTESLIYPDTTMVLTSYDGLYEYYSDECYLSEAYPNPFNGCTNVLFNVNKAGQITVKVMNMSGQTLSELNGYINEGAHQLTISLDKPQLAFIVVSTSKGQFAKKIINIGYGERNKIEINQNDSYENQHCRDIKSGGDFSIGDVMSYVAIKSNNGNSIYSNNVTQAQYNSQTIMLTFSVEEPSIFTANITGITINSAISGGIVTSDGGCTVVTRGVCWSTSPNPTTSDSHTTDGSGTGSFTSSITGLSSNTTYYVRAYATNSVGTAYGSQKTFTTEANTTIPTVTTNNVTNITSSTATCGGNVTSSGNGTVTARGVCWGTSPNPTTSDSHTTDGSGTGSFTSSITGLNYLTTYYVRAYAINEVGIAYGSQQSFTTEPTPAVTTNNVTNITSSTATCGGNVTSMGSANVTARGVCWSTSPNPTISDPHTIDGSGAGAYSSTITGLNQNTTYYVKAYATNFWGTSYGSQKTFTTESNQQTPTGAINGLFSVSATQTVYFSQGNLQYQASTNTWRFATHQYDYVGESNSNISSTYTGWIDLFCWGTSGYNHGAVCYQPYSTSQNWSDYNAYGSPTCNLNDQNGQADWGYNAISNGGNIENVWRTLTISEWQYVFGQRSTPSGIRYVKAQVNGINGVIILPDDWNNNYYTLNNVNTHYANYNSNVISSTIWNNNFESHGAVFLPAAGRRIASSITDVGYCGFYWSATQYQFYYAYIIPFDNQSLWIIGDCYYRIDGHSVRLVQDY